MQNSIENRVRRLEKLSAFFFYGLIVLTALEVGIQVGMSLGRSQVLKGEAHEHSR